MIMLVSTKKSGEQQTTKTPILSLNNTSCLLSSNTCANSLSNNVSVSPTNLAIMSALDVSTPTTPSNVSPHSANNNNKGNNLQCSSSNNNSANQKYEVPYGENVTSPSDGNNGQNLDDSSGNNKNKSKNSNGINLSSMDSTSRGERDSLSNISSTSVLKQSSTNANSCSAQFNESSPNNVGDSSSNSSNAAHINNDKSNEEEKLNNIHASKSSTIINEEEKDKSNSSSSTTSSTSGNAATSTSISNQTSISSLKIGLPIATVKDEKDLVQKEETSLSSPNMSPVGFGSIVGTQVSECNDNPGSATNKSNDSSSSCDKRIGLAGNINKIDESSVNQSGGHLVPCSGSNFISKCNSSSCNKLNSKSSSDGFGSEASTSIGSNVPNITCNVPLNASFIIKNVSSSNGPPQAGAGSNITSIISSGGGIINNCLEYMQQQNHIFVFSTQLANKGAEAVLGGQCPTIIAYHCTQPATKSFLEDFFLKNPMKITKLQRQNALNIMGGHQPAGVLGSGAQPAWLAGNCNSIGKMSHKLAINKSETLPSSSSNSNGGAVLSENDMICWDQTRSALDNSAGDSTIGIKILENTENSENTSKSVCNSISNDESGGIPSLQGVKVPDENLTPQQRQHREEQLAKLKKMNQFLFPENGSNDFHSQTSGNNPIIAGKMQVPPEVSDGGIHNNQVTLINMQSANTTNKLNAAAMRNIAGNLISHAKSASSNSQLDNMPNLVEDIVIPADIIGGSGCGSNDMVVIPPSFKQGCMTNVNNTGQLGTSGGRGLMNASIANFNMINNSSLSMLPGNLMNESNNAMTTNNSDLLLRFNSNHCIPSGQDGGSMIGFHKNMNTSTPHPLDINSPVGMSQMEWSKIHHHLYEERLKNNHPSGNSMTSESSSCQQTLMRCNSTGIGGAGMSHRTNPITNANNRGSQGPPPPYHPTQRSASVPIAMQSPNPSSPNNPTSNMSLPSPRASNVMGGVLSSTTSPNMDITAASSISSSNTNFTTTPTISGNGGTSGGNGSTNKNTYSQQDSPTPCSSGGNSNRNRSTTNTLNSNPTTPLSHVSPKDIDSKSINTTPTPDHKATRAHSQRSRSPLLNDVSNNNIMESRFPSPGLNFASIGAPGANPLNVSNTFKNQNSSLERQNLQQMQQQFCRRTDNMPLNPNSNRSNQSKMSNSFDPISSLAQMSQQLTGGGIGHNSAAVGSLPNNMPGLMGGPGGVSDINMNSLIVGPMMSGSVDPSMDHCSQNPNGGVSNMGMSALGGGSGSVVGPFGPGNCNMMGGNAGPICQRMLNPKMCGPNMSAAFNPNQVAATGMRDGPSGFPGMMPTHRIMNHRMPANFGNFNVSPNIQVKASTPNTIQYMPVRSQNNNSTSNVRVPPSLEFLQRYANPQMMGNSGNGVVSSLAGSGTSPSVTPAMSSPSDSNKMPNTNNMGGNPNAINHLNFFGNCNATSNTVQLGSSGGGDQDELQVGGMISSHDPMNIPGPHAPMLRGMRPIRQSGLQSGVGMNPTSRMQNAGMANISSNGIGNSQFSGNDNESLECNDNASNIFNNPSVTGIYQQKINKPPPMGMSHGPLILNHNNNKNLTLPNNVITDQNSASNPMQSSVILASNNPLLNSSIPNSNNGAAGGSLTGSGNIGYKTFVCPTSNDLKYAQQYHSFQQQLYATSTRNQHQGGGQQQSPNTMSPNSNPNAGFFVSK